MQLKLKLKLLQSFQEIFLFKKYIADEPLMCTIDLLALQMKGNKLFILLFFNNVYSRLLNLFRLLKILVTINFHSGISRCWGR